MPFVMPTQIDQINDYSHLAGRQVIDALQKQGENNPWDKAKNLLDTYLTNRDNAQIAEAIAQYNQGIESGLTAAQALAGIAPWIAGSEKFRKQADAIRTSRIQQDVENRLKHIQAQADQDRALQAEADLGIARYLVLKNRIGDGAAAIIQEQDADKLRRNHIYAKEFMKTAKDDSLQLNTNTPDESILKPGYIKDIERRRNEALYNMGQYSHAGAFQYIQSAKDRGITKDNIIKKYSDEAKLQGYKASDVRENVSTALSDLEQEAIRLGLPVEAAYWAAEANFQSPNGLMAFFGRDLDIAVDPAKVMLRQLAPAYLTDKIKFDAAQQDYQLYNPILENRLIQQLQLAAQSRLNAVDLAVRSGDMSPEDAERFKNHIKNNLVKSIQNATTKGIDKK